MKGLIKPARLLIVLRVTAKSIERRLRCSSGAKPCQKIGNRAWVAKASKDAVHSGNLGPEKEVPQIEGRNNSFTRVNLRSAKAGSFPDKSVCTWMNRR